MKKYHCDCQNIGIGTYANQVTLNAPKWSSRRFICVDKCLMQEILELWKLGIITTGCCCGHNRLEPYIGVEPEYANQMEELGYKHCENESAEKPGCNFIPKSIKEVTI